MSAKGPGSPVESASQGRVRQALKELGQEAEFRSFSETTRSAQEAADAIGCSLDQIAKSMVFRAKESDRPVLVVASGGNRIDLAAVSGLLGEKVERADPAFVRARTGFAIGGVAPVGHLEGPVVFIDEDLFAFEVVWAAAGTPFSVFALTPEDLLRITGGARARLAQSR